MQNFTKVATVFVKFIICVCVKRFQYDYHRDPHDFAKKVFVPFKFSKISIKLNFEYSAYHQKITDSSHFL